MEAIEAVHPPAAAVRTAGTVEEVGDVLDWRVLQARSRRCLRCGSDRLRVVEVPDGANFLCLMCRRCWELEDGYLVQVNPHLCSRCRYRRFCLFADDAD